MHRFFIPPENIHFPNVAFPEETAAQIRKVLRLKTGQQVCVLDNSGKAYVTEIAFEDAKTISGRVLETTAVNTETAIPVTLFIALTKRDKFEWILQKCTEAGVSRFVPILTERGLVQDQRDARQKLPRWRKIVQEAAEQSERAILPELSEPLSLPEALQLPEAESLRLFFWERGTDRTVQQALADSPAGKPAIALMVGPEGGFSAQEAAAAEQSGWQLITLGRRILRMETAALVAVVLTIHEMEREPRRL